MIKRIIRAYKIQRALYPDLNIIQRYLKHRRLLKKRKQSDRVADKVIEGLKETELEATYRELMRMPTIIAHHQYKELKGKTVYEHKAILKGPGESPYRVVDSSILERSIQSITRD